MTKTETVWSTTTDNANTFKLAWYTVFSRS